MRSLTRCAPAAVVVIAALAMVAAAAAQSSMPKLPGPYQFAQTGDSPGKVTFNHTSHVDVSAPSCTGCHPKAFSILKAGATSDGKPITHAAMDKGHSCGACHNGKTSFGFDDCTLCHR
ncbi:MAG TPA: c(7)-type cytochrome triheme domain-containing protein [Vicinamibacterales bacterium]|nr:c(7)-type cytochrome triheme domain-containing protein [Vicinamibacterales bacterium]